MAQASCGLIVLSSSTGLHLASTCRPGSRGVSSNEPRLELRLVHRNLRARSPVVVVVVGAGVGAQRHKGCLVADLISVVDTPQPKVQHCAVAGDVPRPAARLSSSRTWSPGNRVIRSFLLASRSFTIVSSFAFVMSRFLRSSSRRGHSTSTCSIVSFTAPFTCSSDHLAFQLASCSSLAPWSGHCGVLHTVTSPSLAISSRYPFLTVSCP